MFPNIENIINSETYFELAGDIFFFINTTEIFQPTFHESYWTVTYKLPQEITQGLYKYIYRPWDHRDYDQDLTMGVWPSSRNLKVRPQARWDSIWNVIIK